METTEILAENEMVMRKWVEFLITRSCWFSIMPLPDDVWKISVKANEGHFIHDHHYKAVALCADDMFVKLPPEISDALRTTQPERGHGGYDDRDQT